MRKVLSLVLSGILAISLVACGGGSSSTSTGGAKKTGIKVGMVTDVGGVNDQSFNQSSWEGLKKLGSSNGNVQTSYLESKTDADYASNIESFINEGYDLIICVGYMLADATREAAKQYPNQKFAIIDDASNSDLPNVACLTFAQEEASYLVGVVAGMMTKTNVIGYVQGMVSDTMNLFGIGYVEGAKSVNPDVVVLQQNANNFADSATGAAIANDMFTKGADVIYHAAGGTGAGVISSCQENGIFAIGVDSDQSYIAPNTVITSAMKRVDNASVDISLSVLDGTFNGGVHRYNLVNGGVDIAPTQTLLPSNVVSKVNQVKQDIINGNIKISQTARECPDFTLR